jgi:hypothetical protein
MWDSFFPYIIFPLFVFSTASVLTSASVGRKLFISNKPVLAEIIKHRVPRLLESGNERNIGMF